MVQVLRQLPRSDHPDLLVGTDHFDDAGVFRIDDDTALVQTLDFFPPLVDDPFTFGQIAATNSLSDVYAMGGRPLTAMNIVGFPDKDLPAEILVQILQGGAERVTLAGAVVVGGHTVRDSEVKYGLAVTGLVHPDKVITNATARAGDTLVLTKPIGSGVLTSAAKKGDLNQEGLAQAIEVMIHLNEGAARAMIRVGVHAVTDITGFGLIGHAFEMADGAGVSLEIQAQAVPLLDRTLEFARQGFVTRAHQATLTHLGSKLDPGRTDSTLLNVLADAQTSGGLLIAVAADRADSLVAALQQEETSCAAVIGQVTDSDPRSVRLI